MQRSERHINNWDLRIHRRYSPVYFLGRSDRFDPEPTPPVIVELSAEFDTEESALDFERKVRELLEKA